MVMLDLVPDPCTRLGERCTMVATKSACCLARAITLAERTACDMCGPPVTTKLV